MSVQVLRQDKLQATQGEIRQYIELNASTDASSKRYDENHVNHDLGGFEEGARHQEALRASHSGCRHLGG